VKLYSGRIRRYQEFYFFTAMKFSCGHPQEQ
jgi:hypothetical protein